MRFALQTFSTNGFQVAIEFGRKRPQFRRRFVTGLFDDRQHVSTDERRPTCEQVKKNGADAVDIGCGRQLF